MSRLMDCRHQIPALAQTIITSNLGSLTNRVSFSHVA